MSHRIVGSNTESSGERWRQFAAGAVGNVLEWYDFAVFGYLAPVLARVFFSDNTNPAVALTATFAVFAVGFAARPLGGFVFSAFGDSVGRRRILNASIIVMAIPTVLIGFLPTFDQVGLAAPALLVALRIVQGMAVGAEFGGAMTFIAEHSPDMRRARNLGLIISVIMFAMLLGSAVSLALTGLMRQASLDSWGWRIAFWLSGPMAVVFALIRRWMHETPAFERLREHHEVTKRPLRETLRKHWRLILKGLPMYFMAEATFYAISVYVATYLSRYTGMSDADALLVTSVGLVAFAVTYPIAGLACDRFGRKPVLYASIAATIITPYFVFRFLFAGNLGLSIVGQLILGAAILPGSLAAIILVLESFATRVRFAGFSTVHNLGTAAFGGTAPFVVTFLITATGNRLSAAWFLIGCGVITLPFVHMFIDGARRELT